MSRILYKYYNFIQTKHGMSMWIDNNPIKVKSLKQEKIIFYATFNDEHISFIVFSDLPYYALLTPVE